MPRMGKKGNDISNSMNIPYSFTSMITHGYETMGFRHNNLSLLDMASSLTMD
jgi:hypothetical protein